MSSRRAPWLLAAWTGLAAAMLLCGAGLLLSPRPSSSPPARGLAPPSARVEPAIRPGRDAATPRPPGPRAVPATAGSTAASPAARSAAHATASPLATASPRPVTATPSPPARAPELPQAVDWPELPSLEARQPLTSTQHFRVFAEPPEDALLGLAARSWAPELEPLLAEVGARLGDRRPAASPIELAFVRGYDARCPARGLASVQRDPPLLLVFLDETTGPVQIRAVLAHEMAHHLSLDERFVGDGVLTEGIANWGAGRHALAWQGWSSWPAAARSFLRQGRYVSITDDTALQPRPGEDCIERRDRVYTIRTAFVDWLIERIGLERVLAMPRAAMTIDRAEGEAETRHLPDYEAATGLSLVELEARWLAELRAEAGIEAW